MNNWINQFVSLPKRDQWALLLGGGCLMIFLVWMLLLSPLRTKVAKVEEMNKSLEASLGRVQLLVQQIKSAQQNSPSAASVNNSSLTSVIDNSLHEAGMSMSSFQPGANGEMRIRVDKGSSDAVFQWLADLEYKHHLVIRDLSLTALNEPGQVSINLRLIKP